jgi:DNA-binding protein HU-beta
MNKADIIEYVHQQVGGSKAGAERLVNGVFDRIIEALKRGEEVSIAGFGIFSVRQRAARQARNPRTGEMVQVPAMRVPKFRASKGLKDAVK